MPRLTTVTSLCALLCLPLVGACATGAAPVADQRIESATTSKPINILREDFAQEWQRFKRRYVLASGRVVDSGNEGVSHSEGQGYGLLFALGANDRATFENVLNWTQNNLQRKDGLHFWRFNPNRSPAIDDPNAAADGELLIAWALFRAARQWQDSAYRETAQRMLKSFEARLIRKIYQRTLIIPWDGAALDRPVVINPSYFIFPAMQDIAIETQSDLWISLYQDCLELLQEGRFGEYQLAPDWYAFDAHRPKVWGEREPYFSYDAIRIPLHLVWASHDSVEHIGPYLDAWQQGGRRRVPAWIDLTKTKRSIGPEPGPAGFRAVRATTENLHSASIGSAKKPTPLPGVAATLDYFSASLVLLARLAEIDWWQAPLDTHSSSTNGPQEQ